VVPAASSKVSNSSQNPQTSYRIHASRIDI